MNALPRAQRALHLYLAAQCLNELLHDRQAESRAAGRGISRRDCADRREGRPCPVRPRRFRGRSHLPEYPASRAAARDALGTLNPTTSSTKPARRELQRVGDQVVDDLEELYLIDRGRKRVDQWEASQAANGGQSPLAVAAAAVCNSATVRQTSTMSVLLAVDGRAHRMRSLRIVEDAVQDSQQRVASLASLVDQGAILLVHVLSRRLRGSAARHSSAFSLRGSCSPGIAPWRCRPPRLPAWLARAPWRTCCGEGSLFASRNKSHSRASMLLRRK